MLLIFYGIDYSSNPGVCHLKEDWKKTKYKSYCTQGKLKVFYRTLKWEEFGKTSKGVCSSLALGSSLFSV